MDRRHVLSYGAGMGLLLAVALLLTATVGAAQARPSPARTTSMPSATGAATRQWAANAAQFQRFILLYASGDAGITRAVTAAERSLGLSDQQIRGISAAVRLAWLRMMRADPASVGRPNSRPNVAAQRAVFDRLMATLRTLTASREPAFLALTNRPWSATLATILASEYRPRGRPEAPSRPSLGWSTPRRLRFPASPTRFSTSRCPTPT